MLGVEAVQLIEGRRAFILGDRTVLFLQPADKLKDPVPVTLGPQCLGDVRRQAALSRFSPDLVEEILRDGHRSFLTRRTGNHTCGVQNLLYRPAGSFPVLTGVMRA
ncbi:hypothetical protein [Actinacidiphila sp. ITFR-21]|uniref:hypothetical protein n=1 Tax=Actinacidiphila sp. ITFR-21 TaxID=3075199 RepID=UPI0037D9B0C6